MSPYRIVRELSCEFRFESDRYVCGSFFDRSAKRAQVLSKRQASVRTPGVDVCLEAGLTPECAAKSHFRRLIAFGVAYGGGQFGNITSTIERHENYTIVVAQNKVVISDDVLAAGCG